MGSRIEARERASVDRDHAYAGAAASATSRVPQEPPIASNGVGGHARRRRCASRRLHHLVAGRGISPFHAAQSRSHAPAATTPAAAAAMTPPSPPAAYVPAALEQLAGHADMSGLPGGPVPAARTLAASAAGAIR